MVRPVQKSAKVLDSYVMPPYPISPCSVANAGPVILAHIEQQLFLALDDNWLEKLVLG